MVTPDTFGATWPERLSSGADVLFRCDTPSSKVFTHAAIADAFIESLGLTPIGFNWELLDAQAPIDAPRSALGEMTKALGFSLTDPGTPWLAPEVAEQCAKDFLDLFDRPNATFVSNRYDGLWNPIAGQAVEWGFVGFDSSRIAILLLAAK